MLVLGVDSGATKTDCAIANEEFEVLGVGVSGPSNYHVVGAKQARRNVELAIKCGRSVSDLEKVKIDIGCFGMAGLNTNRDSEVVTKFIKSLDVAEEYLVVSDAVTSYYAVTLGKPGVGVIAGTGSMAYGSDNKGAEVSLGGWGWLIGDEGGAFYIARKALMHVTKAVDGRASDTLLIKLAKNHFGVSEFDDLITTVYHNLPRPQAIASFAKSVSKAAQSGDRAAKEILTDAGKELAILAEATAKKVGIADQAIVVGCTGGVCQSEIVWNAFQEEVRKKLPRATLRKPVEFPVIGLLVIGLNKKGIKISEKDVKKLESGLRSKLTSKKRN